MKKNIILGIGSTVAVLALASSAYATTDALRYSTDGLTWTTVTDNGLGDTSGVDNVITVNITGNGWTGSVSTGHNLGSPGSPALDVSLDLQNSGAGSLYIEYGDVDFHPIPGGSYILDATGHTVPATGAGTFTSYAFVGPDSIFAGTDPSGTFSTFPPAFSPGGTVGPISGAGFASGVFPTQPNPYSITIATVYTTPARGGFLSGDVSLTVPDGGNTLMLLGSALSVLGLGAFRRKAVKA